MRSADALSALLGPARLKAQWRRLTKSQQAAAAVLACLVVRFMLHLYRGRSRSARMRIRLPLRSKVARSPSSCVLLAGGKARPDSIIGSEPRASEQTAPWVMKTRIIRHMSFFDVYRIDASRPLGEGLNGQVVRAVHRKSGRKVAAKCLKGPSRSWSLGSNSSRGSGASARRFNMQEDLPEELTLYMRMSHPNICRLLEAYIERGGDCWLIMEYCRGGELFEQVAGTSKVARQMSSVCDTEERVAALVKQMAAAFRYIHSMGVVHRDNKLENWVFASPAQERIKLIDFGFAAPVPAEPHGKKLTQVCGTCYYVAPEVLSVKKHKLVEGDGYGAEVDIWSLGIIIYMLISGRAPFNAEDEQEILWEIAAPGDNARLLTAPFSGRRWRGVSSECRDLITRCLERDPQKRITAAEVQAHPWLNPAPVTLNRQLPLTPFLHELLRAGVKMHDSRILAFMCGHLAERIFLSPQSWTELRDIFFRLEGQNCATPRGVVFVEELVSQCLRDCSPEMLRSLGASKTLGHSVVDAAADAAASNGEDAMPKRIREVVASLDLTGDGRLHFCEFLAALVCSGRLQVPHWDIENAFAAFDVDSDGTITEADLRAIAGDQVGTPEGGIAGAPGLKLGAMAEGAGTPSQSNPQEPGGGRRGLWSDPLDRHGGRGRLRLPIRGTGEISACIPGAEGPEVVTQWASPLSYANRVASDPFICSPTGVLGDMLGEGGSAPSGPQRLLSKCAETNPWKVERRNAFTPSRLQNSTRTTPKAFHSMPHILGGIIGSFTN